jgi:SpoIIAA-like
MIEKLPQSTDKILGFKMSGKLHDEDYKTFVPVIDAAVAKGGKIRLLAQFHDFHGWDMHALWDDIKFSTTHCTAMERIALVGDKAWEKWMAKVCVPFSMAKIKYFEAAEIDAAWKWLQEA